MIPESYITAWSEVVPWGQNVQLEQDLIICRALCSIYSDAFLSEHLAFRGGTALGKIYLKPQPRYSEDIDLVQVQAEPIRETINHLRLQDDEFLADTDLILRPGVAYNAPSAWQLVQDELIIKLLK